MTGQAFVKHQALLFQPTQTMAWTLFFKFAPLICSREVSLRLSRSMQKKNLTSKRAICLFTQTLFAAISTRASSVRIVVAVSKYFVPLHIAYNFYFCVCINRARLIRVEVHFFYNQRAWTKLCYQSSPFSEKFNHTGNSKLPAKALLKNNFRLQKEG